MPALRNLTVRRSRRLSKRPPADPEYEEYDVEDLEQFALVYPADYPAAPNTHSTPTSTPAPTTVSPLDISPLAPVPESDNEDESFVPRSSHSRKRKDGHIPRPPNAFMLFRSELWAKEKIKSTVERDHRQISRIAGHVWNKLSDKERAPYKRRAELAKKRHAEEYPDYKYAPVYRSKVAKRKTKRDVGVEEARCRTLAHLLYTGVEGSALEQAVSKMDEDGSASGQVTTESHTRSAVSSSPYASTSRRVALSRNEKSPIRHDLPREAYRSPAPAPMSPIVKREILMTPELCDTSSELQQFIPTSDIPPLDLSASSDTKSTTYKPHYIPEELDPHFVEPMFSGLRPTMVPLDDDYMAWCAENFASAPFPSSSSSSSSSPEIMPSTFYDSSETESEPHNSPPVQFTNPFAPSTSSAEYKDIDYSNFDILGNSDVSPCTADFPASTFELELENFDHWVNL